MCAIVEMVSVESRRGVGQGRERPLSTYARGW